MRHFALALLLVAAAPPETGAPTIVTDPAALARLRHNGGVTLQWITDKPLTQRYKVFVQLLDGGGKLIAQHDTEPGNNLSPTTSCKCVVSGADGAR